MPNDEGWQVFLEHKMSNTQNCWTPHIFITWFDPQKSQNWPKSPAWYDGVQVDWLLPPTHFHTSLDSGQGKNIGKDVYKCTKNSLTCDSGRGRALENKKTQERRTKKEQDG